MNSERYSKYILEKGHEKVEGWVAPGALTAMRLLMLAQEELNILGDIAEIGVHHGRYFIAMALHARASERLVAVDLFEAQHLNLDKSGRGDRERFITNLETYGVPGSIERTDILQGDSTAMSPADFSQDSSPQFRFFSVDGGHMIHHVKNDLALAEMTLVPGGIAVVDDFFNPDWPGVAEGIFSYCSNAESKLIAFAYGDNKIYLSDREHAVVYASALERERHRAVRAKEVVLAANRAFHIAFTPPEIAFRVSRSASNFEWDIEWAYANPSPSIEFGPGWTPLTQHGVWSEGERAELSINLPAESLEPTAQMLMTLYPFAGSAASREVRISSEGSTQSHILAAGAETIIPVSMSSGKDGKLRIVIHHPPIGSPKDVGSSDDSRCLGVLLSKIEIADIGSQP